MQLEVGKIVEGKITGITNFGAFVQMEGGKTGLVHISEVALTFVKDINDHLKEGDGVKVKVLSIDDNGKVSLSMKAVEEDAEVSEELEEVAPENYVFEDKSASNTMASLFANIKLN